jgi:hypothetical protein
MAADPIKIDDKNFCFHAYYSSNFCTRKDCLKEWKLKQQVGRGAYGTVYDTCLKDDCKYVIKIQLLSTKDIYKFDKEVLMSKRAAQYGLAPEFKDSFMCKTDIKDRGFEYLGFIVLEKWESSLDTLIKGGVPKETLEIYFDKMLATENNLLNIGIWHKDTHPGNFVIKTGKVMFNYP